MSDKKPERELFELSIWGGSAEAQYRRACPGIAELPWGTLDQTDAGDEERLAARREWTDAALGEYSSAAVFSVTLRALLRARVPIDLSALAAQFPVDEIAHAELCARMAAELGGGTPIAYERARQFPAPTVRSEAQDPVVMATERVVYETCVRETWSLAVIKALARGARQPLQRALWTRILDDEKAHAGFGWTYLEWVELDDAGRAAVAGVAKRAIAALRHSLDLVEKGPAKRYSRLGIIESIGRAKYLTEARKVIDTRIEPQLARYGIVVA